jgi:hypothetical protein
METQMAKKRSMNMARSVEAAGGESLPQSKTAAAKRFLSENPELVTQHTHKELAELISQKYGFAPTAGDVANAKGLILKGSPKGSLRRRSASVATPFAATISVISTAAPKAPVAAASATDAVNATLNLVRAVGLEQATAIISGLTKSN